MWEDFKLLIQVIYFINVYSDFLFLLEPLFCVSRNLTSSSKSILSA